MSKRERIEILLLGLWALLHMFIFFQEKNHFPTDKFYPFTSFRQEFDDVYGDHLDDERYKAMWSNFDSSYYDVTELIVYVAVPTLLFFGLKWIRKAK